MAWKATPQKPGTWERSGHVPGKAQWNRICLEGSTIKYLKVVPSRQMLANETWSLKLYLCRLLHFLRTCRSGGIPAAEGFTLIRNRFIFLGRQE